MLPFAFDICQVHHHKCSGKMVTCFCVVPVHTSLAVIFAIALFFFFCATEFVALDISMDEGC